MSMDIEKLVTEHHQAIVEKGFYVCPKCKGTGELKNYPMAGNDGLPADIKCFYCKGADIDPNKNIGELLAMIVGELCGEAVDAHRCGKFSFKNVNDFSLDELMEEKENQFKFYFEKFVKDTFEDEIADTILRIFDLCGYLGIELQYRSFRLSQNYRKWDNVASDLYYISCKLPPDTGYAKDFDITSLDLIFSLLLDFCEFHNIPIEKHIAAKMAYNKTREYKHGKDY